MERQPYNVYIARYMLKHYYSSHRCRLCNNSGIIKGLREWCICANGQTSLKHSKGKPPRKRGP